MDIDRPTLDCQDCGFPLKNLSPAEVQQVASNPYNFIVYCGPCHKDRIKHAAQEWNVHPANALELAEHLHSIGVELQHEGKPL